MRCLGVSIGLTTRCLPQGLAAALSQEEITVALACSKDAAFLLQLQAKVCSEAMHHTCGQVALFQHASAHILRQVDAALHALGAGAPLPLRAAGKPPLTAGSAAAKLSPGQSEQRQLAAIVAQVHFWQAHKPPRVACRPNDGLSAVHPSV